MKRSAASNSILARKNASGSQTGFSARRILTPKMVMPVSTRATEGRMLPRGAAKKSLTVLCQGPSAGSASRSQQYQGASRASVDNNCNQYSTTQEPMSRPEPAIITAEEARFPVLRIRRGWVVIATLLVLWVTPDIVFQSMSSVDNACLMPDRRITCAAALDGREPVICRRDVVTR